tara:strand:- start:1303 stop:1653 length:351 start_codon:yes stop_codon:yes gene_type:complete
MSQITRNIEAATKAVRILLENQQAKDLPSRVDREVGVKTKIGKRLGGGFSHASGKEILSRIEIKTNIHGEDWGLDSQMERLDKKCLELAKMFNCQCWFEDFGSGTRNRLEVYVSHA